MKKLLIIFLAAFLMSKPVEAQTKYKLFFFGGQSNMDGLGKVNELPEGIEAKLAGAKIFHGNPAADETDTGGKGIWANLKPGHGFGFSSDGEKNNYSDLFGPELNFSIKLKELEHECNIAIIKYSRSGTSIDIEGARQFGCWHPDYKGVNQFSHFKETVKKALENSDLDGDGIDDILIPAGILWMQGESDGDCTQEIALRYEDNLRYLINSIRSVFGVENLPVVIGKITDSGVRNNGKTWPFGEIVMDAQKSFVEKDKNAAIVTETDSLGYTDFAHYNSEGFLKLGALFAEKVYALMLKR